MGIDTTGAILISESRKKCKNFSNVLMIGRQEIHVSVETIKNIFTTNNLINSELKQEKYAESIFFNLGANNVESIDNSNYEGASIIQDMNYPISNSNLLGKYDFIFDGGAIEHVFNSAQYIQNIVDLLSSDGIYACVTCNNNFSGHGFYQLSPEFFNRCFQKKYGMELLESYLFDSLKPENNTLLLKSDKISFRDTTMLTTNNPVYICVIARKTHNGTRFCDSFPQQHNYENLFWK
jgi:hypothetical protein